MKIDRKFILSELRDYLILLIIGSGFGALSLFNSKASNAYVVKLTLLTSLMWIVLWKGNSYIADYLSEKISWIRFPMKRFLVGFVATVAFTIFSIFLISLAFNKYNTDLNTTYTISVVITLIISLFMHGRNFLINWKEKTLEADRYHRETLAAKYDTLKNQVNPHFLFNSLNALTNLVYEDKEKAVQFVRQLAVVYRYVLDAKDKEVATLADELLFLKSYLFLQQIRFGNKLRVTFDIKDDSLFVAPLALQMLIENAIKHNIVSEADPLTISVNQERGMIVVRNNLQLKTSIGSTSTGVGLENISRRYESLGQGRVQVTNDGQFFTVGIPVLKTAKK